MKKKYFVGVFLASALLLTGCSEDTETVKEVEEDVVEKETAPALTEKQKEVQSSLDLEKLFSDPQIRGYAERWIGLEMPQFTMTSADGGNVSLEDYKGKDFLLELASTTCPACIQTQPQLNEFSTNNPEIPVLQVFGENESNVTEFMKNTDSTNYSTALPDGQAVLFETLELMFTPTTFFIDQDGIIQFIHIGSFPDVESIELYTQLAFEQ